MPTPVHTTICFFFFSWMQYPHLKITSLKFSLSFFVSFQPTERLLRVHVTAFWITYFDQFLLSSPLMTSLIVFILSLICVLFPTENEDCCVHCILACLFCEFLTLCNIVLGQASCGICTSEACCCCCGDEMGEDCNCPCDMDCGIMDACCESSDCLEICMECCGICFPS